MTTFHLIRHGKASARGEDYDVLSELGVRQAELLGASLGRAGVRFAAVYAGPLRRHLDTLRIMTEAASRHEMSWPPPVILEGLREAPLVHLMQTAFADRLAGDAVLQRLVGEMAATNDGEGSKDDRLRPVFRHMTDLWVRGEIAAEGVESYADFAFRVSGALEALAGVGHEGGAVAVVSSVGAIAELLRCALRDGDAAALERVDGMANASVTELSLGPEGFQLRRFGDVAHLAEAGAVTYL
jgi:broad specificity phosphatase PhoE